MAETEPASSWRDDGCDALLLRFAFVALRRPLRRLHGVVIFTWSSPDHGPLLITAKHAKSMQNSGTTIVGHSKLKMANGKLIIYLT